LRSSIAIAEHVERVRETDVILEQLGGQASDGSADRSDQHQDVGAADF
jgi:hypothetical protein